MALRTADSDTKDKQDAAYNPGELKAAEQFPGAYSSHGADQAEAFANDPANSTKTANEHNKANIDTAKDKEESASGWKNNFSGGGGKQKLTLKGILKKKGPVGLIVALLGGGGILTTLLSPGLLLVDLKEKMLDKFNDQFATMDVRTTALIKKKFSGTTTGLCTSKLTIRCRFDTMSDRQFKKLEKSLVAEGGKINKSGETLIRGRAKIDSIEFGGRTIRAENFASELRANPAFRGAMIRGYNPKLAGFADSLFTKLSTKIGVTKQKNIGAEKTSRPGEVPGETAKTATEQMREELLDTASGDAAAEASANAIKTDEACSAGSEGCENGRRTVYRDSSGTTISQAEYDQRISNNSRLTAELAARRSLTGIEGTVAKATLKGVLTSTAMGLGAVDSACTGYTLIRTVGYAAKYLGALQLLRYAHVFMNTADSIVAGDATPEQVEFVGNILTSPNVIGLTATDSYGYKYAAYGDVATMDRSDNIQPTAIGANNNNLTFSQEAQQQIEVNDEKTKYINGQLVSNNILASIISLTGKSGTTDQIDEACGFVKSGWGQSIIIGAAVVGAVVAFFSGGLSVGWGAGVQAAVSVAISVAIAMLTPKLIDMAAGRMINGFENGNRAGNALTSGMGSYNAQTAQARGVPALKKQHAMAYQELTEKTIAQYKEVDRHNRSPLDPTSPNTFVGSILSRIAPYTAKTSTLAGSVSSMSRFAASSLASIIPTSHAAENKAAQYNVCEDIDYKNLELAADPFCNIRYGLKEETLAVDPDTVVDYMVSNNYIDDTTGAPKESDNDYAEYIKNCMDRSVSIGGFVSEDDTNKGEECIQDKHSGAEENKYNMFRLFYIDQSIDEGMENGYPSSSSTASNANGGVVSPVTAGHTVTSGYGPRGPVPGASGGTLWHAAIDMISNPSDVMAVMAGDVVAIEGSGVNTVTIKHADGLKTRYMHMYPQDVVVKVGDKVTAGQKLGKIGCAGKEQGYCSGDHLDFSIWIDEVGDKTKYSKYKVAPAAAGGDAGKAINPANFLKDNGVAGYDGAVNEN